MSVAAAVLLLVPLASESARIDDLNVAVDRIPYNQELPIPLAVDRSIASDNMTRRRATGSRRPGCRLSRSASRRSRG